MHAILILFLVLFNFFAFFRPTFIHRLLIGNTVEEKIMAFLQTKVVSGIR